MTTTSTPLLDPNTIYATYDRFVCTECAGTSALYTGITITGYPVRPVNEYDVAEWATYDLGPLTCECGRVSA